MKKLFLTICFLVPFSAQSAVRSVASQFEASQAKTATPIDRRKIFEGFDNAKMLDYVKDRFEKSRLEVVDAKTLGTSNVTSVIDYSTEMAKKNKDQDSLFQQMYEDALKRLNNSDVQNNNVVEQTFPLYESDVVQNVPVKSNFASTAIKLPFVDELVNVPSVPHIPYFFSDIEVMSTGESLVEEDIIVLNNKGVPYIKAFNKYLIDRDGNQSKLDFEIIDVLINGESIEYVKKEAFNNIIFTPKDMVELPAGVYEYKFNYVIKNNLSFYDDVDEFFFNISGKNFLPITRAGVSLNLPKGFKLLNQDVFIGGNENFSNEDITFVPLKENSYVYVSRKNILPDNGFYLVSAIAKDAVISPDFFKAFWQFIDNHSDVIFALLGFIVIGGAYLLSLKSLDHKISKQNLTIKKTAPMMRMLLNNVCDARSLVAFLLEIYRKGIIDFVKNDDTVLLVKKTDALPALSKYEKLAVNELFANRESVLSITFYNKLKLQRALQILKKGLSKTILFFGYKLNSRYLLFSFCMLLVSLLAISAGHLDFYKTLSVVLSISGLFILNCFLFCIKTRYKVVKYILQSLSVVIGFFIYVLLSSFIDGLAALLVLLSIVVIFVFSYIFLKRSGLLQRYIKEVLDYKSFLEKNLEQNITARDLMLQQAAVFALEVGFDEENAQIKENSKLVLAQEILKIYNRKK